MKPELTNIYELLQRTFEKGAWHGPSVKEALAGVSAEESHKRLPGSHSIIELVAHMTSWRIYVVKKLQGDVDHKVTDQMNFPTAEDWAAVLDDLDSSQQRLLNAIKEFDEARLPEEVVKGCTYYTLLHSIIHHDLYHAGQIVLIKKQGL